MFNFSANHLFLIARKEHPSYAELLGDRLESTAELSATLASYNRAPR